jgi:perosamine synthetase
MKIPLSKPWISKIDKHMIMKCLDNSQLTDGPILRKFESTFAKITKSKYAIGVSNGTQALQLSLIGLGVGKGDEVIIPDLTFVATANAVVSTGAKPILADVNSSLNISTDSIKDKISKKTKAIIPVHFAGLSCNMKEIVKITKKFNLKMVEDCAHSFGTTYEKKHVGTFGETGCFSFYPTKNITSIEGGMIITDSKKLSQKLYSLRNHGLTKNLIQRDKNTKPWDYDIIVPGFNFRLDEVRSTLGHSQLSRFKKISSQRISAANYYNKKLKNIEGLEIVNLNNKKLHAYHLYIIRINKIFSISRDQLHLQLFKKGIRTTVHYKPIHMFSYFQHNSNSTNFPNSINAYNECLSLPLFPTITKKQQDYVIQNILKFRK